MASISRRKFRICPAYFMCGGVPYETAAGAPGKPDFERARQLRREGGYMQPTAYRKNVRGVLRFPATILWNISLEA